MNSLSPTHKNDMGRFHVHLKSPKIEYFVQNDSPFQSPAPQGYSSSPCVECIATKRKETSIMIVNVKNVIYSMSTERKCHRWTHISVNVLLPVFLLWLHHCGCILHSEAPNLFLFPCHNPVEPTHQKICFIFADLKQENQSDMMKHL